MKIKESDRGFRPIESEFKPLIGNLLMFNKLLFFCPLLVMEITEIIHRKIAKLYSIHQRLKSPIEVNCDQFFGPKVKKMIEWVQNKKLGRLNAS